MYGLLLRSMPCMCHCLAPRLKQKRAVDRVGLCQRYILQRQQALYQRYTWGVNFVIRQVLATSLRVLAFH